MGTSYELRPEGAVQMTRDDARALTDEVKYDAERLWLKLVDLYNGGAHGALGYKSWRAYCAAEFQLNENAAYHLLGAGRVMDDLWSGSRNTESHTNCTTRRPPLPTSEGVARELRPVHAEEGPKAVRETWEQVVEEFGPRPTAAQTREVVRRNGAPKPPPTPPAEDPWWVEAARLLAKELEHIAKHHAAGDIGDHIDSALSLIDNVRPDLEKRAAGNPF